MSTLRLKVSKGYPVVMPKGQNRPADVAKRTLLVMASSLLLVWLVGFAPMSQVLGQSVKPIRRQSPPWLLEAQDAVELDPPAPVRVTAGRVELGGSFRGAIADLNGDGTDDYIFQFRREECGTGGCPYEVFDGATGKSLGLLSGNPLIVRAEATRGFLNIDAYSHATATSGSFTSYAFDGRQYAARSTRRLTGPDVTALFATLSKIPRWQPPGR